MVRLAILGIFALPFAAAYYYERNGEDWKYLEDYITQNARRVFRDPTWNEAEAKHERGMGTYWNVRKAHNFPLDCLEVEEEKKKARCGVVFYYPDVLKRAEQKDNNWDIADYGRPLAMSPFCEEGTIPTVLKDGDFPGRKADDEKNKGSRSVVFHALHPEDVKDDIYFVLSATGASADTEYLEMKDFQNPSVNFPGSVAEADEAWNALKYPSTQYTQGFRIYDSSKIQAWVQAWLDKNHKGLIPNPYRFGVGAPVWAEYTGINDFWGYDGEGRYAPFPKKP